MIRAGRVRGAEGGPHTQEADDEIGRKPLSHFRRATEIQLDELQEHLDAGDREAAAREVVDAEINVIARDRAEHRMKGQASQILAKYEGQYGIGGLRAS